MQTHLSSLLELYQNGRLNEAEKLADALCQEFPSHNLSWKILGAIFRAKGRDSEALNANQTAVALSPRDAQARYNLGITLQELHRFDEAEASYRQAIALKPDYDLPLINLGLTLQELGRLDEAEAYLKQAVALKPVSSKAHNNLGNVLLAQGCLDEALASYVTAIGLKPDFAIAHNNMGLALQELGRSEDALDSYRQAITLEPDYAEAYVHLGYALKKIRFNSPNPELYPILSQLLTVGNFVRPSDIAGSVLSLLKHDPLVKRLLLKKSVFPNLADATFIIKSLSELKLLHHLMRVCPLPDLQFEKFFVMLRRFVLANLGKMDVCSEVIYFLSTLSIHCFVNEYVYAESPEEVCQIEELENEVTQIAMQSGQPELIKVLCLASYRPLHRYNWCQKVEVLNNLNEVNTRLIEEPLADKGIAERIPALGAISNDVSLKVKEQYEENPYPRWVKLGVAIEAKSVSEVCDELKLQLQSENIKTVTAPRILIAGCGTGQHSISTASRFSNCSVTAVDLSCASLAYAQRKSDELGFTNLEYFQADILGLRSIGQEFDIIESSGVLHHLREPMAGWAVLTDVLKSGGLMKVGLYSELARSHIKEVRRELELLNLGTSESEIREFRQFLMGSHYENHERLTRSADFFTVSTLRDLIFHVQEHQFTLPQIKNCLDELRLKFCGFDSDAIFNFRKQHGQAADIYDLSQWHQHEESFPQTFAGMYQFWCQKT